MRQLLILIGTLTLFGLTSPSANACNCGGPGTPCESYGAAAAVFAGTAVSVRENKRPTRENLESDQKRVEIDWTPRTFKFLVEQPYLGVAGAEIEIATGSGGGDCGYPFNRLPRTTLWRRLAHSRPALLFEYNRVHADLPRSRHLAPS